MSSRRPTHLCGAIQAQLVGNLPIADYKNAHLDRRQRHRLEAQVWHLITHLVSMTHLLHPLTGCVSVIVQIAGMAQMATDHGSDRPYQLLLEQVTGKEADDGAGEFLMQSIALYVASY